MNCCAFHAIVVLYCKLRFRREWGQTPLGRPPLVWEQTPLGLPGEGVAADAATSHPARSRTASSTRTRPPTRSARLAVTADVNHSCASGELALERETRHAQEKERRARRLRNVANFGREVALWIAGPVPTGFFCALDEVTAI